MGIKVKSYYTDIETDIVNKFDSLGLEITLPIDDGDDDKTEEEKDDNEEETEE